MTTEGDVSRAIGELGDLVERRPAGDDAGDGYDDYADRPVAFARDVLDADPWADQVRAMRAVRDHDRVAWRGANAVGKDWTVAALALWWAYARQGLVLVTGPTARQVNEVVMRREIARAWHGAGLPGELFTTALRIRGDEASIVAATSTEAGRLQGFHDRRVLGIITEAQDVEPFAWEGVAACATGPADGILAVGNPLRPSGRFHDVSRPGSGWRSLQTSAHDHPNLDADADRWIPGGPSESWVDRMRDDYGAESPIWRARVEGEFPTESVRGLFRRAWIERAGQRWARRRRRGEVEGREPLIAALDPSRLGGDASVLAVRRGRVVDEIVAWRGAHSTTELVQNVVAALRDRGFRRREPGTPDRDRHGRRVRRGGQSARGTVVVDEPGLGGPVLDRLDEIGFRVRAHNGAKSAQQNDRFANRRAETHWQVARALEDGEFDVPPDDKLVEELLAVDYTIVAGGRVQIEAKADIKARIGRSPDRADACVMALAPPAARDGDRDTTRLGVASA